MIPAKAQVYGAQEGSGLAQVVDTSKLAPYFSNIQNQRTARQLERTKRKTQAMKDYAKLTEKMATPSYLHEEEFFEMSRKWRDELAKAAAQNPMAVYDPTSDVARGAREGMKAEELFAKQSIWNQERIEELKGELGKGNYRDDVILATLDKAYSSPNMKSQYEVLQGGLVPELDPFDVVDVVNADPDTNVYENEEGVTTKTVLPSEDRTRVLATGFFSTEKGRRYFESGVADGYWNDIPSAIDWVVEKSLAKEGSTISTTRDNSKGGLKFNFPNGGNKADYGDYSVVMYEQGVEDPLAEGGVNRNVPSGFGDAGVSFDIAYKGKSAQANTYTAEGGKTERGYIKRIEANPKDPDGAVLVIKSTAKIDTENFDPDKDSIDRLPTVRVPLNEDNKATLQNTVGMNFDEVIQQYRDVKGIKSKPKANPTTPQENKGAKGKWGSSKSKIGAE